jgi:polysaccharide biosynthesis protein PslG
MRNRARLKRGGLAVALALGAAMLGLLVSSCSQSSGDPPLPTSARSGLVVGLNSVWNNPSNLTRVAAAGMRMERLEIDWPAVEPVRGRWNWSEFDKQFAVTANHGITILPLLMAIPPWMGAAEYQVAAGGSGFSNYVAQVVRRYGPNGQFWRSHPRVPYHPAGWFEIWNEPYLPQFSSGGPQPEAYARLYKAAVQAGRKVSSHARFLIAADTTGVTDSGSLPAWVEPMYRAVPDLSRYIDGIATHPYSSTQSPLVYVPGHESRFEFRRISRLRSLFAAHGAGHKPFWITEIGWSTCPQSEDCVNEAKQATYLSQIFTLVKSRLPWVKAVFVYNYRDSPQVTDPTDKEHWFGVIRRDGSPKPAWNVLRAAAR